MHRESRLIRLIFALSIAAPVIAQAQDSGSPSPILPGRPDAATPSGSERLGAAFEDAAAGIAFQPPTGLKQIRGLPGVIVRYVDDDRHWVLTVSKLTFERPVRLSNAAATPARERHGKNIQGHPRSDSRTTE